MKTKLTLLFIFLTQWVNASHIFGGEITYKYISKAGNGSITYAVKLSLFLDCKDGNPSSIATDATAFINVFDAKTGSLIKSLCKTVTRQSPVKLSVNSYKCIKNSPDVCVDMYIYETNVVLPAQSNGYIVTFERCCRNAIIENINNPGNTGATYWTEIKTESINGKNSSPIFKSRPPIFLCLNAPFTFDHSATDEDGDSLVYEITTPYFGASTNRSRPDYNNAGSGTPVFPLTGNRLVQWKTPYNINDEMGGNPILEVDELTGRLTITPTKTGQFVIGIKVKEYRNGVFIGETKRDYQFNVSNCVFEVISNFIPVNSATNVSSKLLCTNAPVNFVNASSGAVRYHWDFGVTGLTNDTSNKASPTYLYPSAGTYKITLLAINTVCIDTFIYIVTVKEAFKVNLGSDTTYCQATTLNIDAGNIGKQFLWNTGASTQSITVKQTGNYSVIVTDGPCIVKDTLALIIDESVFDAGKDTAQCNPIFVPFTYSVPNLYKSYLWNNATSFPTIDITSAGKYWVTIINQNDCKRTDTIEAFYFMPPKNYLRDTMVCIGFAGKFDAKILNYTYLWNTNETSRIINPLAPGQYKVSINNGFCYSSDSAILSNIDPGLDIGRDTSFCGPFNFNIQPTKNYSSYLWNNGAYNRINTLSQGGLVKVTIMSTEGCFQSDSLMLINYPLNRSNILGDTLACTSSILDLVVSSNSTYVWNTGENTQRITTQEGGIFSVIVTDTNGCNDTVFHKITKNPNALPNEVFMPNAFTPNGDKLNENYPESKFQDIHAYYNLMIFNRWGEKLFETNTPSQNWDGHNLGTLCQNGVYMYTVNYIGCDNQRHMLKGEFNLIR